MKVSAGSEGDKLSGSSGRTEVDMKVSAGSEDDRKTVQEVTSVYSILDQPGAGQNPDGDQITENRKILSLTSDPCSEPKENGVSNRLKWPDHCTAQCPASAEQNQDLDQKGGRLADLETAKETLQMKLQNLESQASVTNRYNV
jgi:hypothetical protein